MENIDKDMSLNDLNDLKIYDKKMKSIITMSNRGFIFQLVFILIVLVFVFY